MPNIDEMKQYKLMLNFFVYILMIRLHKNVKKILYCLAIYACTISLQAQNKIFEAAIHSEFESVLESKIGMCIGSENLIVQKLYSPLVIMNKNSREKKYWGQIFEDKELDRWGITYFLCYTNNDKWIVRETYEEFDGEWEYATIIYDATTLNIVHKYPLRYLDYASKDGKKIFSIGSKTIAEFDVNKGTLDTILYTDYGVSSIHYPTKSELWFVVGGKDDKIYIYGYSKNTNKEVLRIDTKEFLPFVNSFNCDISDDGESLVATVDANSNSAKVVGYSLKNRKKLFTWIDPNIDNIFNTMSSPKISHDGQKFVILSGENLVYANIDGSNLQSFKVNNTIRQNTTSQIFWLDEKRVAIGRPNEVVEFNLETKALLTDIVLSGPYEGFSFLYDKKNAIMTSRNGYSCVNLFDKTLQWKHSYGEWLEDSPFDVSEKTQRIAYVAFGEMYICNVKTGELIEQATMPYQKIRALRFSQSGNKILFTEPDSMSTVNVYDINTKKFSTIELGNTDGKITDVFFEDETSKEMITIHQFGANIFDLNGEWIESSINLRVSHPFDKMSRFYRGLKLGYGKILSDNGLYIIGHKATNTGDIGQSSQLLCQERKTAKTIHTFNSENDESFIYITLTNSDKYLTAVTGNSYIYTWDISTGERISKRKLAYTLGSNNLGAFASVSPYDPSLIAMISDTSRFIAYTQSPITSVHNEYGENITQKSDITSYPQPIIAGDGQCTLNLPSADIESLTAVTVLGEIIPLEFSKTSTSTYRFSVENLSTGQYSLQIITERQQKFFHTIIVL